MSYKILVIKPEYDAWPVGIAYVLACLEKHDVPFDFVDSSRSSDWKKDVRILLNNNGYTAIASGGLVGFETFFQDVKSLVADRQTQIPMILGGNITKDASTRLLFEYIGTDFGIIGEAETSLPGLIEVIARGDTDFKGLPGVIYRNEDGLIVRNAPTRLDLNNYTVIPAWHYFDVEYYVDNSCAPFTGRHLRFMPVVTGRGCVGCCSFCSPTIGGFKERPIEHVLEEIRHLSSRYSFDRILFYNEMLYPSRFEISAFCSQYQASGINKPWFAQVRVDADLDVETLSLMKDAGCIQISAGIESGSDKVLKQMNKKTTAVQIRDFFRKSRTVGLPACGTFIVGSEGETEEDLKKTIDLVIEEKINTGAALLFVYPGTAVYRRAVKRGLILDEIEHLEARWSTRLRVLDSRDRYLNYSAMPDETFLNIVVREVRRYETFLFNRYPVSNLSYTFEFSRDDCLMVLRGQCHECGAAVCEKYPIFNDGKYRQILGYGVDSFWVCSQCFSRLAYNIYLCTERKALREHGVYLKECVSKASRLVLVGCNSDARSLLSVNMIGMDYQKLVGFVDNTGRYTGKQFANYPVLSLKDMVDVNPDCILLLDCAAEAELEVKRMYKRNLLPEILQLCDEDLLYRLRRIGEKLSHQKVMRSLD